jgi:hypothetical protein
MDGNDRVFWRLQDRDTFRIREYLTLETACVRISPSSGTSAGRQGSELIPRIHEWILENYPQLRDLGQDILLYGQTQSEKTGYILRTLWIQNYVYLRHTTLILNNDLGSFAQVMTRIAEFNRTIIDEFGDRAATLCPISVQQLQQGHRWLRKNTVVLLGNASQMRRFREFRQGQGQELAVVFDEADTAVKSANGQSDETVVGPILRELHDQALFTMEVTATPFAQLNTVSERRPKILIVPLSADYRNSMDHEYLYFSDEDDVKLLRKGDPDIAVREVDQLRHRIRLRVQQSPNQKYSMILLNVTPEIKDQERMGKAIATRTDIQVWLRNSKSSRYPIQRITQDGVVEPYTSCLDIADLFNELERRDQYSENVIIACNTASRGTTFRPRRSVGSGGLHAMIYLPSPGAHAAAIIQAGGRIDGKYEADYPKIIIKTDQKTYLGRNAEIFNNYPAMLNRVADPSYGDIPSREKIENLELVHVGKHDRKAVDDTNLDNQSSIMKRNFDTPQEVLAFLDTTRDLYPNGHTIMTQESRSLIIPGISSPPTEQYRTWRTQQHNEIKRRLGLHHNHRLILSLKSGDDQFTHIHDMKHRFHDNNDRYRTRFVAGVNSNDEVRVVVWKPRFSAGDADYARPEEQGTAYLFETTEGKWRFFAIGENRRFGRLSHQTTD